MFLVDRSPGSPEHALALRRSPLLLVLEAANDFDSCGGVSIGLIAWEFSTSEEKIAPGFAAAIEAELLRVTGRREHDEEMWELTARGRAACDELVAAGRILTASD